MNEAQKIKKLLEEYKTLLEVTDMDVAESLKGQWFFFRYNAEDDYFDALYRFETAKELAEIILGELAMDMFVLVDGGSENLVKSENLANDLDLDANYKPYIERLMKYMEN